MNDLALSVNEENWGGAMEALAESGSVAAIAAPVSLLMNSAPFVAALSNLGLTMRHALRPMGVDAERYLFEKDPLLRKRLLRQWLRILSPLPRMGVQSVALDLGLDRISAPDADAALALRIETLKHILSCLEDPLTLAIRVRYPADYPRSRAWERAARIVHAVMDPACRLQADVFPEEVEDWQQWQEFEKAFHLYTAVLALHCDPCAAASLADSGALDLCASLQRRGFRGLTMCCLDGPQVSAAHFKALCRDLGQSFSQPTV